MAKPGETTDKTEPDTPWGTWEELLLACAVHRYGTKCWDSVAVEIQKRSPTTGLHHLLTPQHCEQKYHDLKRRYTPQNDPVSAPDHADDDKADSVPWLDELKKLRVAELKRELQRYDLSIVALQLKVKRLKEERDRSLTEDENDEEKSDLKKSVERDRKEEEKGRGEPEKSPESVSGKPVTGDESDRENQSVNESNSTDPKIDDYKTGVQDNEPEPVRTGEGEPDPPGGSTKPAGEDSCNGSSDSIAKEVPVRETPKAEPEGGVSQSDSPELWESVAESKDEGTAKESSDVQSSASKSRKEEGSDKVLSGSIVGNEPENKDRSPTVKRFSYKSQPLVDFIEIVRSHKFGSVFERRLESQDTPDYRSLIRQHVDLETIQTRLEEGWYSGCTSKFYRDFLLLLNNAIIFFGRKSKEFNAAIELRKLVVKEMARRNPKTDLLTEEPTSVPSVPPSPHSEPEPSDLLLLKPKISGPIIVCLKRSSIAAKASGSSSGADRKKEQEAALVDEKKPVLDWKQHPNKSSGNAEELRVTKKRSRDRFTSGSRNSRKNINKNSEALSSLNNQSKGASSGKNSNPKSEKSITTATASVAGGKKRSAANLTNRTSKQSSSGKNGSLLDTLKNSGATSNNSRGAEQRRNGNSKDDAKKEQQGSRRASGGRQAKEQESPARRSVGRPPKGSPAAPPGKRGREKAQAEAAASRQHKKRSRK
ncbi:hypothetical protein NMG60_11003760 [Bertholletia excelsa]